MKIKLILTVLCCTLFFAMNGQTVNTSFAQDVNNRFNLLEKQRVPYYILLDYGFDIVDATQYDGVLRSDNYMTISTFNELFNTIVSSATSTSANGLSSPVLVQQEWASLQKNDHKKTRLSYKASVVLNGLLFNYSRFDPNALNNNKIQITNGKYDDKYINGVWQNPYLTDIAFAVTSPVSYINSADVEVRLPSSLWHSNTTITNIQIDFGNGSGYKSLNNGTIASTNYLTDGTYTWTYRVRLSNGQYKYSRQKVIVQFQEKSITAGHPTCGAEERVPITATKAYLGEFGSATLEIVYNTNGCNLTRPLIVAEGLDTGLLGQAGSLGDNSLNDFISKVNLSQSIDLNNLLIDNNVNRYDIVYVNWDNGTDYIQRNAFVLEEVIKYVNEQKALAGSTEDNVVLGQSMGGLIARYALRDMEDNPNLSHDTSLYISHDSPHQGAHIPLGLLYLARHVGEILLATPLGNYNFPIQNTGNFSLLNISDLLDAPAVRQLLINYVDSNVEHTTSYNAIWQSQLKAMGYPQQTRNIALSNASHCGETQGLVSNGLIADIYFKGGTGTLVDLVLFATGLGSLVGDFFDDSATFLLGFLPGKTSLKGDFQAKAFPSTGTANIYYGKLTYEKTLVWLLPIRRTLSQRSFNSVGNLFLDNYPGGVNPIGINFAGSDYESGVLGYYNYNVSFNPNFDFIPVTSALDVGSGNTTLSQSDYLKTYSANNPPTGSKTIPFVNFTTSYNTSSINEPHISFNSMNGDWLAEELDNDAITDIFDCTFLCSPSSNIIKGSSNICSSSTYTANVSGDAVVNWSVSNTSAASLSSSTGSSVTLTATSGYRTNVILTAVISSAACGGNVNLTKSIWIGKPGTPSYIIGPSTVRAGAQVSYQGGVSSGASSYVWRLPYPYTAVSNFDYFGQDWQLLAPGNTTDLKAFTGYGGNNGYVQVMGRNACGTGGARLLYVTNGSGGGGGIASIGEEDSSKEITVYPNPASLRVNVKLTKLVEYDGEPPTKITAIEVLDHNSQVRKVYRSQNSTRKEEINIAFLSRGLNFLIVHTDQGSFTVKLLVQ